MMNISADVSMKSFDSRRKVENMLQNKSVMSTHGVNADPRSIL